MSEPGFPTLDPRVIERFRALDPTGERGTLSRVLSLWEQACESELSVLTSAVASGERSTIRAAAHRLRGSTNMLGGLAMGNALRVLESEAAVASFDALTAHVKTVEDEREKLVLAFRLAEAPPREVRASVAP